MQQKRVACSMCRAVVPCVLNFVQSGGANGCLCGLQKHSCMDLQTGSDLQRSGTGVRPGSESKMGHICMGTFKQGRTCKGPGPGSDPVPNWKSGGPCNYVQKRQARSSYKKTRQGLAGLYSFTQAHARDISCMGFSFSNHVSGC